jgi:hypothetical protein
VKQEKPVIQAATIPQVYGKFMMGEPVGCLSVEVEDYKYSEGRLEDLVTSKLFDPLLFF